MSWRDLQWRRRRFTIAIAGTALVFAITLLMTGFAHALRAEAHNTVDAIGGDAWVVPSGVIGPLTGISVLPADTTDAVRAAPGVHDAFPLAFVRQSVTRTNRTRFDVNVFGYRLGGLGAPPLHRGRLPTAAGEVVADTSLHEKIGATVMLDGHPLRIVGLTSGLRLNAGVPNLYTSLDDVQTAVFGGQRVIDAVITRGVPSALPPGLATRTRHDVVADEMRLLAQALATIDMVRLMMWLVAAALVGSVIYLSALERGRDFAVFKAVGAQTRALAGSLSAQAVVISVVAALAGAVMSHFLEPLFPLPVSAPISSVELLPIVAVAVGLLASLAGLRRAVSADPALAFSAP